MTVAENASGVEFAGDGSDTTFPFTFPYLDSSEIVVTLIADDDSETVLTLDDDYALTPSGSPAGSTGGTITMDTAPAADEGLRIERVVALTQTISWRAQGAFTPSLLENALDKLTMALQQLDAEALSLDERTDDLEDRVTTAEEDIVVLQSDTSTLAATAITAVGSFGATPNAAGASVSGPSVLLQPADATHPGAVSIAAQAFGGAKTFAAALTASTSVTTPTADLTTSAMVGSVADAAVANRFVFSSSGAPTANQISGPVAGGNFYFTRTTVRITQPGILQLDPQAAPSVGNKGELYVDTSGILWICTASGTPGTWAKVGTQS